MLKLEKNNVINDETCTRHVTRTTTIEDAIHHGRL